MDIYHVMFVTPHIDFMIGDLVAEFIKEIKEN